MLPQKQKEASPSEPQEQLSDSDQLSSNTEQNLLNDAQNDDGTRKVGKWTSKEDELLRKYVPLFGEKQWRKISEYIPGRTSIQCLHRWTKILKPGLVKGPWTAEEDQKLLSWIRTEGATKWAQCANYITGRSGKQCRERWFNNLNPNVKKGNWAKEEDELIFELYQKYGSSWSKIAKFIPGRTENAIKNRFYSTLRKLTADKKKEQLEKHEDLCLGEEKDEKPETPPKDNLDMSIASQAPNVLYSLLNGKTTAVQEHEGLKRENSTLDNKKNANTMQSEKQHQQQAFNINGEKLIVVRDTKPNEKNIQEAANKLFNTEIEDNDNAFEDFLGSLHVNLKDDFLKREFEPTEKPDDITHLDGLQKKILNFCQTNIKDLAEAFKMIDTSKASTTASEISASDVRNKFAPQPQNSSMTIEGTTTHQETSNIRGTTIITPTPNTANQKGFSLRTPQLNIKAAGSGNSPNKGPSPKGFSLYNPANPLNKSSKNGSENSSENKSQNAGGSQLKPLKVPVTAAELEGEGKMSVEKSLATPFTALSQQGINSSLVGLNQKPGNGEINETEKRMTFLFQQLYSLEMLLSKTRNDLIQYESSLRTKGSDQENIKMEDFEADLGKNMQRLQRPLVKLNSEFEQLLKKKKVE